MSRITKLIAEEVSEKLVQKKQTELNNHNQQIKDYVTKVILNHTPKDVLLLSKTEPKYFRMTKQFRFNCNDFKWEYFSTNHSIPSNDEHYNITETESKQIFKLIQKRDKLRKELRNLKDEIYQALINLKTFKRVQEEFPEASSFLPSKTNTSLVVNIDNIRKQL